MFLSNEKGEGRRGSLDVNIVKEITIKDIDIKQISKLNNKNKEKKRGAVENQYKRKNKVNGEHGYDTNVNLIL